MFHSQLELNSEQFFTMFSLLILPVPNISESCTEIKIKLNVYFDTSLWCLKRFNEGLKGLHKTFWSTTKKCENKNLTYYFFYSSGIGTGRVKWEIFCKVKCAYFRVIFSWWFQEVHSILQPYVSIWQNWRRIKSNMLNTSPIVIPQKCLNLITSCISNTNIWVLKIVYQPYQFGLP